MYKPQRTSHNCKVLRIGKDQPAIYFTMPYNHTIAIGYFNFAKFNRLGCRSDKGINLFKCS